jgi:hypothetical protein
MECAVTKARNREKYLLGLGLGDGVNKNSRVLRSVFAAMLLNEAALDNPFGSSDTADHLTRLSELGSDEQARELCFLND